MHSDKSNDSLSVSLFLSWIALRTHTHPYTRRAIIDFSLFIHRLTLSRNAHVVFGILFKENTRLIWLLFLKKW
jgi:hypothetical protein